MAEILRKGGGGGLKNKLLNILKKFLTDPDIRFNYMTRIGLTNLLPDKRFLRMKYHRAMKYKLNIDKPVTFNEKLQWLKLYDRRPEYTVMVDKYKAREYIAEKIGGEYLIPLIGVWDSPDEIDFDDLPEQFAMKCNHNSGLGMCICTDKSELDVKQVKRELRKGLKQDYYLSGREWPYRDVPRKIIAEQFMKSDAGGLTDYKIHCFNGKPKVILVCKDRFLPTGLTEDFFSPDWEHLDMRRPKHPNASQPIPQPEELSRMLSLARTLSDGIPFLRVDFYIIEHQIYFSELTFFPASGFERFVPERWDRILGDWLTLPEKV